MPVVPLTTRPVQDADRERLIEQLAHELESQGSVGEPLIFERAPQPGGRLYVLVVWSAWENVPRSLRAALILEAYHRYDRKHAQQPPKAPRIGIAAGETWEEANRLGLFPFSIAPNARADGVTSETVREAMLRTGAVQTPSGIKLWFPSRESAEETFERLQAELPQAHWSLNQIVDQIQDQ